MTGVTAALSAGVVDLLDALIAEANHNGVAVSFDVNYRSALWSPEEARPVLRRIVDRSNVVFCSVRDGRVLFDDAALHDASVPSETSASVLAQAIRACGAAVAVVSMASEGMYVSSGKDQFIEGSPQMEEVVDRIGAGDALAAGVLSGYLLGDVRRGARLGSYLSGLALGQVGDLTVLSEADVAAGERGAAAGVRIER